MSDDNTYRFHIKDRFLSCCNAVISTGFVPHKDRHALDEILDAKQREHSLRCISGINANAIHWKAGGEEEQKSRKP